MSGQNLALATRLEPSVVPATAASWAALTGRRAEGVRALSIVVVGLPLVDPFLVESVGLQLSAVASGGIVAGAPVVASRRPGPEWLRVPSAVTIAAQVAVAQILWWRFGPIGLVSLTANQLADWAAGFVMVWGAGVVAGGWSAVVAWPVDALVGGIDWVARVAVRLPLPRVEGGLIVAAVVPEPGRRCGRGEGHGRPGDGRGTGRPEGAGLHGGGIRRARNGVAAVVDVVGGNDLVAPPMHRFPGAWPVTVGSEITIRGGVLTLEPSPDGAALTVGARAGTSLWPGLPGWHSHSR